MRPFGHPDGVDRARFQLFAPFERDRAKWERCPWVERYRGQRLHISTTALSVGERMAQVQTYRDVLSVFRHHPEAKSADRDGHACDRQTAGLLQRRAVTTLPDLLHYVGKESNRLEEAEAGLGHNPDDVSIAYDDPR